MSETPSARLFDALFIFVAVGIYLVHESRITETLLIVAVGMNTGYILRAWWRERHE